MRYEAELERALEEEFGGDFEGDLRASADTAAASADSSQKANRDLYRKYAAACQGRRRLKRLTKVKLSWSDEDLMLKKRIEGLPQLFQDLAALKRQAPKMSQEQYRKQYAALVTRLGYPPDIYLGRLEDALADAKCELSWSSWMFVAPCNGMEVEEPEYMSGQAADHYVKTVLGRDLTSLKVTCKGEGRWCDVDYPNGITIRVGFYKIPDSLVVVQVAPKLGVQKEFRYGCFGRTVNLY